MIRYYQHLSTNWVFVEYLEISTTLSIDCPGASLKTTNRVRSIVDGPRVPCKFASLSTWFKTMKAKQTFYRTFFYLARVSTNAWKSAIRSENRWQHCIERKNYPVRVYDVLKKFNFHPTEPSFTSENLMISRVWMAVVERTEIEGSSVSETSSWSVEFRSVKSCVIASRINRGSLVFAFPRSGHFYF